MSKSYCGIKCNACEFNKSCCGCVESEGRPFGAACVVAECCRECPEKVRSEKISQLKNQIISEINAIAIPDMPKVTSLYSLRGSFVNLEYNVDGNKIKYLNDDKIYLGCQLEKSVASESCYGVVADEEIILICEYGENGSNPKLVLIKER